MSIKKLLEDNPSFHSWDSGEIANFGVSDKVVKYIYSKLKDDKSRNYVCIEIATSNVYVTNVLREWIYVWSKDDFKGRPNGEQLREILPYLLQYKENIKFKWAS